METAIRWSQSSTLSDRRFLYVDVTGKALKLCRIKSCTKEGVDYETIALHTKVPAFRAFDWSPTDETLVAVGQSSGEATVLRLHDESHEILSFQIRSQRLCNAVALSTQNLLAAGLDKVRNDFCLNVWDVHQRLPASASTRGLGQGRSHTEPLHKLASSEPITSVKFFQDNPQTLVTGVKGQFVRLYDLREPLPGGSLQFATRCVHNLAIDSRDENYIASCSPSNDPTICIWDRRYDAHSRHLSAGQTSSSQSDSTAPQVSLELKNVIDSPGQIWSLRFAKTQRGCLGVLSSTGHFKANHFGTEYCFDDDEAEQGRSYASRSSALYPESVYLNQTHDIERAYYHSSEGRDERERIVSFDFVIEDDSLGQPNVLTLTGNGKIKLSTRRISPQPRSFSPLGYFSSPHTDREVDIDHHVSKADGATRVATILDGIRRRAEPRNTWKLALKHSKQSKAADPLIRTSSLRNHEWNSDLGYFEPGVTLRDLLTLSSAARLRCEADYLFSPTRNKSIVSESQWLQTFWTWIERAMKSAKSGLLIEDSFDLSYLGVHALWMDDIGPTPYKTRTTGPTSTKLSKVTEDLAQRLNIAAGKGCSTEYPFHRQLCLHVSGLASTHQELEMHVKQLVYNNQHTKAAAIAIFSDERKLAYKALHQKSSTQSHKMLAMAIAGAVKRARRDTVTVPTAAEDTTTDSEEDEWSETVSALAEELTDPYARAILALVRSGGYEAVIAEESLPLKYRVGVALRWLSDSTLTSYISKATKDAIAAGDVEGVILTGIGTSDVVELMGNYIRKFGDLQTAVLALSITVPRYVDDQVSLRKFYNWRESYRSQINSWGLKYDRVRFDIASQRLAVDHTGKKLIEPAKPQIALVCGYCSQSLAQFDKQAENVADARNGNELTSLATDTNANQSHKTQRHPLTSEKAAAIGTVCPKCGRHLPRCGVCDMWLGTPDPSYMRWYSQNKAGSVDMTASMTGSVHTTLGPGISGNLQKPQQGKSVGAEEAGFKGTQDANQAKRDWEEMMRKFTVLCIKCNHGFHANHAKEWFGGYAGREGHSVCPVSDCSCVCGS